jgi:hypothetical protein
VAKAPTEIKSLARKHTETALKVLAGIMNQTDAPPPARVAAAQALLDRGWGKATLFVESETTVRYVARVPDKAATPDKWQEQHSPEQTLQ